MKTLILLLFILFLSSQLIAGDLVKIELNKVGRDAIGNISSQLMGYAFCDEDDIRIEIHNTRNTNIKNVFVACLPFTTPITTYSMSKKEAYEFVKEVKGKFKCLTSEKVEKCKEKP